MKKFFSILFCVIVAMVAMSCGSKVEKDIKAVVADQAKVVDVKSINISEDFYLYTNEYTENRSNYENCRTTTSNNGEMMRTYEKLMKFYKSIGYQDSYNYSKENYEKYKAEWEDDCKRLDDYAEKDKNFRENGAQAGKLYIAKMKGKNEYTGKYLDFNSYQIFAYDSDGTIHPIETDDSIQMVCSVYPKAKKDLEKALKTAGQALLEAFSDLGV